MKMVPQQVTELRSASPTGSGGPVFGSQLVDKNSSTPYTDATQVSFFFKCWSEKVSEKKLIKVFEKIKVSHKKLMKFRKIQNLKIRKLRFWAKQKKVSTRVSDENKQIQVSAYKTENKIKFQ